MTFKVFFRKTNQINECFMNGIFKICLLYTLLKNPAYSLFVFFLLLHCNCGTLALMTFLTVDDFSVPFEFVTVLTTIDFCKCDVLLLSVLSSSTSTLNDRDLSLFSLTTPLHQFLCLLIINLPYDV